MTRETRVGLLLGLVFVIAFGMILTELKGTGEELADTVDPTVIDTDYCQQADPHQSELAFSPDPRQAEHPIHMSANAVAAAPIDTDVQIHILPRTSRQGPPVEAVIRRDPGEDIVHPQFAPGESQAELAQRPATPQPTLVARTYRVEEGDTLTHIAKKVYGPDKGHLYTKIFKANRDRLSDASSIYVGQALVIPVVASQNAPAVAANTPQRRSGVREVDLEGLRQFVRQPRTTTRRVYVVQSGDNLTRIARKVLNDTSPEAVDRLYQANKDKLSDRDNIYEGMKLRIPS